MARCGRFLAERNPEASKRAARTIARQLALLEENPHIGRPFVRYPPFRELLIRFGDSGYIALYMVDEDRDTVVVLAFRHQRETGY